ncbi:hypothetical protein ARMSODRAFT_948850 [Armillaria solidipes]|uniref:Uncharacterized protein n=1 Tax=Armillaria solidipes TaxID=1076256 RepID=A0A2H3C1K8_9AGAR|nr:hypothetical protein ARMSODRAFT_948850 [Armillaria solidipes]
MFSIVLFVESVCLCYSIAWLAIGLLQHSPFKAFSKVLASLCTTTTRWVCQLHSADAPLRS